MCPRAAAILFPLLSEDQFWSKSLHSSESGLVFYFFFKLLLFVLHYVVRMRQKHHDRAGCCVILCQVNKISHRSRSHSVRVHAHKVFFTVPNQEPKWSERSKRWNLNSWGSSAVPKIQTGGASPKLVVLKRFKTGVRARLSVCVCARARLFWIRSEYIVI